MALKEHFDEISFHYVPRDENQIVDALATLSAMLQMNQNKEMTIHYHDIREYLEKGAYPPKATENDKRTLRRLAIGFFLSGVTLYKRRTDLTLLRCVDDCEAREIMEEVHEGAFDTHANDHALGMRNPTYIVVMLLQRHTWWPPFLTFSLLKVYLFASSRRMNPSMMRCGLCNRSPFALWWGGL
ncbi:hypothetical protein CR513_10391, partial [Mucuna pruriens]